MMADGAPSHSSAIDERKMSPIRPLPALQLRKASLSFLPQSSAPAAPFSSLHPVRSHVPSTVEVADTRHCKGGHRDERVKTEQVKRDEGGARKYQASPLRFSSRTLYLPPLPFSGRMHAASIADTTSTPRPRDGFRRGDQILLPGTPYPKYKNNRIVRCEWIGDHA
jgi:hypothetical protein